MPQLARITIYPVKSLDGVDVAEARVLPSGALEDDRRFAMVDADGVIVNGKRMGGMHAIRLTFDPARRVFGLSRRDGSGKAIAVDLGGEVDRGRAEGWLSEAIGVDVRIVEDAVAGFPDDEVSPGPTVIGGATLAAFAGRFAGISAGEAWGRFRANLEVGDAGAFWEDRLYGEPGDAVRFRAGAVVLEGVNPCRRCSVPMFATETGEERAGFARDFREWRRETLPDWVATGHFRLQLYRLAVNTRLAAGEAGGVLRLGDAVEIPGDFG